MADYHPKTAVGAGTVAGDATDEERVNDSRAAQAVEDAQLESVRTTGAAPTGVVPDAKLVQAEAAKNQLRDSAHPDHEYAAEERSDLKKNQAGIGSRMER